MKIDNGRLTQQHIERLWLASDKNFSGGVLHNELENILSNPKAGENVLRQ